MSNGISSTVEFDHINSSMNVPGMVSMIVRNKTWRQKLNAKRNIRRKPTQKEVEH